MNVIQLPSREGAALNLSVFATTRRTSASAATPSRRAAGLQSRFMYVCTCREHDSGLNTVLNVLASENDSQLSERLDNKSSSAKI